jgi:exopolyphosphatase/guanosine-5'-triphosphate,3'-diphosphate pyrophosphatase
LKIYFVRHGKAIKRADWPGDDDLRPLNAKGEGQACGIRSALEEVPLGRIYSSPALRCRQTVEVLAADRALSVELDDRLAADAKLEGALELLEEGRGTRLLISSSRSLILGMLRALGLGRDDPKSIRCQKGSIWVLDWKRGAIAGAEYIPPKELRQGDAAVERHAVLDLGSTSMTLLVADVHSNDRGIEPVLRRRAELRLGASAGWIGAADSSHVIQLAAAMRAEAESVGSTELLAVATASLRDAENGAEVAERLGSVLDPPLQMLSGAEEARIVYHAVRARIDPGRERMLALDLGGGSLDLAMGRDEEIEYEASEPLGVTRLHAELVENDPMHAREVEAIRDRVRSHLRSHTKPICDRRPAHCVVAGGTARALARLAQAGKKRSATDGIRGIAISRAELTALSAKLRRASHAERCDMPTVTARRADLLPTGAIILTTLLEELDLPELLVSDWGLREGVLLEGMKSRIAP